jgi:prolyl-tRNA synthetase
MSQAQGKQDGKQDGKQGGNKPGGGGGQGGGKPQTAITPTRAENFPEWYQQVVKEAELADQSLVRGCMVIKPWGFGIWENMQATLDAEFKRTGVQNASFPLFIPVSLMEKEAAHVDGFAKECAVVTHHRLEAKDGKLIPAAPLTEPLIVRPTSEMIIGASFAQWVQSWRDLPLLINQWCNVVRWEMRPRVFLRTAEFLWQEGHTVHETEPEARERALQMLDVYSAFARDVLAVPVIPGRKTDGERFPGAVETYTIEAMMQDGKALQAGTSHFLGQNFAHASGIKFLDRQSQLVHAWTTSGGVSTRLIGALVMTHSDDDGLVLPPRIAPAHAVILPIYRGTDDDKVKAAAEDLAAKINAQSFGGRNLICRVDHRDLRGGEKTWGWVKKGVPVRIEIGPRDLEQGVAMVARRDQGPKEKQTIALAELPAKLPGILAEIQASLYAKAEAKRASMTRRVSNEAELRQMFASEGGSGLAVGFFDADGAAEAKLREELAVTVRCLPMDPGSVGFTQKEGPCILTGRTTSRVAVLARAY